MLNKPAFNPVGRTPGLVPPGFDDVPHAAARLRPPSAARNERRFSERPIPEVCRTRQGVGASPRSRLQASASRWLLIRSLPAERPPRCGPALVKLLRDRAPMVTPHRPMSSASARHLPRAGQGVHAQPWCHASGQELRGIGCAQGRCRRSGVSGAAAGPRSGHRPSIALRGRSASGGTRPAGTSGPMELGG
jgi:hypothetical protein